MTHKDEITQLMTSLGINGYRFIGYNVGYGSRMYGTLSEVDLSQCLETPVAENLMLGMGAGMALTGEKVCVCFERHDFILNAMDCLVNTIDKMPEIATKQGLRFNGLIIRAIVGGSRPLQSGIQHISDHTWTLLRILRNTPILDTKMESINLVHEKLKISKSGAVIVVEYRDRYDQQVSPMAP